MARMPAVTTTLATLAAAITWATTPAYADAQVVTFNSASAVFASTGAEQTYVVPAGATSVHVTAIGGHGGAGVGSAGGAANLVAADIPVTGGQTLYVEVAGNGKDSNDATNPGQGGFNGGGNGAGGGGGASDVRTAPRTAGLTPIDSRLIV